MKIRMILLFLVICTSAGRIAAQNPEIKLNWKLAAQAYTFNRFTFFEAVNKTDSCGLNYIEAFRGQELGGGLAGTMDFHMDSEKRMKILEKLKKKGIKMVSFGVINGTDEADWRKLFEFAKAMQIENIVSEPKEEELGMLSKLCDEFKINLAIHNHTDPSHYWNPDVLLKATKGKSNRIGACADIGHWIRSGLDPLTCLKKLKGHIKEMHFKDLNEKSKSAHDVHWGTGVSNVNALIAELKKQRFKGIIAAEYEYNWYNNVPDVTASIRYFRQELLK